MSILAKLINFCRPYLRSLRDELTVQPIRPAGELIRRMEIGEEITALRNQIAKRRKNKKEFKSLEPRLNDLMVELLKMDVAK